MKLILVGGFLGAGKTTLLWEAARALAKRGEQVGLITNDQAPELVDTALLSRDGARVREVAGSCFCCNFNGLMEAVRSLESEGATCIIAEPVGSCTDLSATIMQPLKDKHPEIALAPLTVLIDPARARDVFLKETPLLHADAAYIVRLQLQEADLVLLSKADELAPENRDGLLTLLRRELPGVAVGTISSATGEGVDAWIASLETGLGAGAHVVEVDYDRYANGEAVLGWLNAKFEVRWVDNLETDWFGFLENFLEALQNKLEEAGSEIGHIKLLLSFSDGHIAANISSLLDAPRLRVEGDVGRLSGGLIVNARAETSPDALEAMVRDALRQAAYDRVSYTVKALRSLQPGRPTPTHRYERVVTRAS